MTTTRRVAREVPFALPTRAAIGLVCLGVQSIIVGIALATRSQDATVASFGGLTMVVLTAPSIVAALAVLETRTFMLVTVAAACGWATWGTWDVMNADASTAALGVVSMPIVTLMIVFAGKLLEVAWTALVRRG